MVARPKVPLISRRATLEAGLRIVDEEGVDALTIRRLAQELNVNSASLYHHFRSKNEILGGVAELALENVRTPQRMSDDWREWLLDNAETFRAALVQHPALASALLQRHELRVGLREVNSTVSLLAIQGVPAPLVVPLMETLEYIALGSVIHQSSLDDANAEEWRDEFPHLFHLSRQASIGREESFRIACRGVIEAFAEMATRSGLTTAKQ